ncbi:polysialyltransferase family glycosyltransferase [Oceanobacillus picturae]|uniref:polysialyltransferase family glycosyltransferase n=1 Tax=Oceanobacillus picturae TaxID=171693 RepID=UPI00363C0E45
MKGNILFSVNTVFHLMMTKLYINKNNIRNASIICHAVNDELPKIINNDPSFDTKFIIDRNKKYKTTFNRALAKKSINQNIKRYLKKIDLTCIIVFKDNDIVNQIILEYAKVQNVKTILIEEGLGIYTEPIRGYKKTPFSKMKQLLMSYPKYSYNTQGINPLIGEIKVNSPKLLPDAKKRNKIVSEINFNKVKELDRKNLFNYFNTRNFGVNNINGESVVLYIGQPFSEFNTLDSIVEKEKISEIFNVLVESNLNILIKPHPSENIDKYKHLLNQNSVKIIKDNHIPVELLPSYYNIELSITIHSSASLYLKKWYGIDSISLADYFLEVDSEMRYILKNLYNVEFVKDLIKLSNRLKALGSK